SARTFPASWPASASPSSRPMPSRTSMPGPICATRSPSTSTAAWLTRWTSALIGSPIAWAASYTGRSAISSRRMTKWGVLAVLGAAQFLMVLDQAVMNVAISQLVEDFDTTVTTIQAVIALYALVMAALMLIGGKLGDIWGRRRAFTIGICIYGVGSGLTAA